MQKRSVSSPVAAVAKQYLDNVYPKVDSVRGSWAFYRKLKQLNLYFTDLPFESSNPEQFKNHLVSEKAFLDVFYSLVDEDTVFADVGAYRGIYSFLASSKGATSYCFEITKDNYSEIEKTIEENPGLDVTAERKAVWSKVGSVKVPDSGTGQSKVGEGKSKVDSVSLDEYFKDRTYPDVVKIDVEGAEGQVLEGAKDLLEKSHPTLFIEFHFKSRMQEFGYSFSELKSALKHHGYQLTVLDDRGSEKLVKAV